MYLRQVFPALQKTMYPDWLSLSGKGYISSMYEIRKGYQPYGLQGIFKPLV